MFRKTSIDLLINNPMSLKQISREVDESPGQIADDLNHPVRSLKHTEYKAVIEPASCRACGFEFSVGKVSKPSKCLSCHSTWLTEPRIAIHAKS